MFHSVLGKSGCAKQGHARWRAEGFVPVFEEQLCLRHPAHGGRHHGASDAVEKVPVLSKVVRS